MTYDAASHWCVGKTIIDWSVLDCEASRWNMTGTFFLRDQIEFTNRISLLWGWWTHKFNLNTFSKIVLSSCHSSSFLRVQYVKSLMLQRDSNPQAAAQGKAYVILPQDVIFLNWWASDSSCLQNTGDECITVLQYLCNPSCSDVAIFAVVLAGEGGGTLHKVLCVQQQRRELDPTDDKRTGRRESSRRMEKVTKRSGS
jgi:hypothetical protein